MIRLFIIEDHPTMVIGIKNLFRPSRDKIEVVNSANSIEEATLKADPKTFDIFMLDLWLPNTHPLLNVKKIKDAFPTKPVVIFTSEDSSNWRKKMFEAGVMAYLLKSNNKNDIRNTLEKVANGQIVFSGVVDPAFEKRMAAVLEGQKYALTPNQKEMVILLSNGLSQYEIADIKKTSISNIEKTLKHIRDICEVRSNAELIKVLLERGII